MLASRLRPLSLALGAALWWASGCTSVVPEGLRAQVDRGLTFAEIARDPEGARGRTALLGGEVLQVQPSGADLDLTLAERPLSPLDESPLLTRASRGEMLVRLPGAPRAAIREGDLVTVVGEVMGRGPGGEPPGIPRLQAKHIHVWPSPAVRAPAGAPRW